MTTRKVVTPSMRGRLPRRDQGRHRWETAAGHGVLSYTTVTPARYFGVEDVWIEPLRVRDKHPGGQDAFGTALELHRSEGTVR